MRSIAEQRKPNQHMLRESRQLRATLDCKAKCGNALKHKGKQHSAWQRTTTYITPKQSNMFLRGIRELRGHKAKQRDAH